MNIVRKARGTEIQIKKQRIFFCCDTDNADSRNELISDLLSMDAGADCVVSYLEAPGIDIERDSLAEELNESQVLVLWVTVELLQSIVAGNIPVEYQIARERHLPIIPIASDEGLFPRFTELVGAIHGISITDNEYRSKLKAQLESLLVSEEIVEKIQKKAFSAVIFLSYRKVDISEARHFMKAFHDLESFDQISIWYDNFLTAGRVFSDEISESIERCNAFVLLVTPNLFKKNREGKDNYVVSTEYPYARELGKNIIPIEAIHSDPLKFAALFIEADNVINLADMGAMRRTIIEKIDEFTENSERDNECTYLLGMAYFKGLGVEKDMDRALRLFEASADKGDTFSVLAAVQLGDIYENGIGVEINYDKALHWRKVSATLCELWFGVEHNNTAVAYNAAAALYNKQGDYQKSLEWHKNTFETRRKLFGEINPDTAVTCNNIALVYDNQGKYEEALEWYFKALTAKETLLGTDHPETATVYNNIGTLYSHQDRHLEALEWHQKALGVLEKALGDKHPATAGTYRKIADVYSAQGEYAEALELYNKASGILEKTLGKHHPDVSIAYNNMGLVCDREKDYDAALEWYQKSLTIKEKIYGTEHQETAATYNNVALIYEKRGDGSKALEWYFRALASIEKALGKEHPNTATLYNNIAIVYDNQKEFLKGLEWNQKALAVREKVLGPEHSDTATSLNNIAFAYCGLGEYAKALESVLYAYIIFYKSSGENHPNTEAVFASMHALYIANGGKESDFSHWLQKQLDKKQDQHTSKDINKKGFFSRFRK